MSVISTEATRYSNVFKQEQWPEIGYCKNVVVVNGPAATLAIGTVLGKVTATGKYKVSIQTATDGSQTADAIVADVVTVASATDTNVLAVTRGPASVAAGALVLDATYDLDAEKLAVYAALEAKGIQVLTSRI